MTECMVPDFHRTSITAGTFLLLVVLSCADCTSVRQPSNLSSACLPQVEVEGWHDHSRWWNAAGMTGHGNERVAEKERESISHHELF